MPYPAHIQHVLASAARVGARVNAYLSMNDEEMAADAPARRQQRTGLARVRPTPKPRSRVPDTRPLPDPSREYAGATSTRCVRDRPLHGTGVKLALWVRARAGNHGRVVHATKGYIGLKLGYHPRTIARQLAVLVKRGYLVVHRWTDARGADLGLMIFVTNQLLPFYLLDRKGRTRLPPIKGLRFKKASRGAGYRPHKHRQDVQRQGPCPPRAATYPS
jgi:hypothetical protein